MCRGRLRHDEVYWRAWPGWWLERNATLHAFWRWPSVGQRWHTPRRTSFAVLFATSRCLSFSCWAFNAAKLGQAHTICVYCGEGDLFFFAVGFS